MRALVKRELDFNKPINIRRLSPAMKIYAGIVDRYHQTDWYKKGLSRTKDLEYQKIIAKDERLKELLLATFYRELNTNDTLGTMDSGRCVEICVQVEYKFNSSLERILEHKDFLPYNVKRVEEHEDIRRAFPEMPILLKVSRKRISEECYEKL